MKIKVEDLTGAALDWAVAKCEGHDVVVLTVEEQRIRWFEHVGADSMEKEKTDYETYIAPSVKPIICVRRPTHAEAKMLWGGGIPQFSFSASWDQGGPIIGRERIALEVLPAPIWRAHGRGLETTEGSTPLIAAMRCYVASKLGDEVDVPEELQCAE